MTTAQMGVKLGICGMAGGMTTTLLGMPASTYPMAAALVGGGAVIGTAGGLKVQRV